MAARTARRPATARATAAALLALAAACGSGGEEAAPSPGGPATDFTGVWLGTATSSSTASTLPSHPALALVLTSSGAAVTGMVYEGPEGAPAAGALSGTAREGAIDYDVAYQGCTGAGAGSASLAPGPVLHAGFWRNTSCDAGAVVVGTANLVRQAPGLEWCTEGTYQAPPGVVGVACSLRIVHGVGAGDATVTPLDAGAPRVTLAPRVTHATGRGCADACTREVTFTFKAGQRGSWRYRAAFVQGVQTVLADLTVVQN